MEDAKETQNRDKEKWIDALQSFHRQNPEWSVVRPKKKKTIIYIRAVQGNSHDVTMNQNLFYLRQTPLSSMEHKIHTHRWTRQICFFSPLNPQDRHRDRERPTGQDPMTNQEWCCTIRLIAHTMAVFWYFNLQRAQRANWRYHQGSSDAMIGYDNVPKSALDKVVTFASDWFFSSKRNTPTLTKPEVIPGDRIWKPTWRT